MDRKRTHDRAQAHTLESFTAALLIVSAVVFSLQATAVTPLTASTSNQHIENQEEATADGLLSVTADDGRLREAVLYWNETEEQFAGSNDDGIYANGGPPNAFGTVLNETFGNVTSSDGRIAYDVFVSYRLPNNETRRKTMVYMGSPSDNAVVATRTVTLFDEDGLTSSGGGTVDGSFYAPDAAPNARLYNVLEVRIVVWKM
ncbi:hypothetical protein ACFFQF_15165 [Haladaptatus pallidirubidus]|uniref:Dirigent protein n=1 Tax=Haladaptatus pallidirubidus TaxID=1008152 RepID=A0AAV3UCA4_9EURY|nr:hypothetical protein [Haladaptatus pallidirubidus]